MYCVFPGSFDPPTVGHLDLIRRAAGMFDRVTVAVMVNVAKAGTIPWDERIRILEKMCREEQVPFIDIATRLKDEEGFLYTQYSSDGRCHLNAKGLKLWVDALLEYAQAQYDQGLWKP